MTEHLFGDYPDPDRDPKREDKSLVRLLGPRLARYAGTDNPTIRRAIALHIEAMMRDGTAMARDVRPTCSWLGCHDPAVIGDHRVEREMGGRNSEFAGIVPYCAFHNEVVTANHNADLEIARLEGEARAEVWAKRARPKKGETA